MIKATKPDTVDYELCPAGTHMATIFKIVNIGTIKETWEQVEKDSHKIRIYWELPNEPKVYEIEKDGKKETVNTIFSISQEYTLSFGEKAKLLPIVTGVLGKTFANEDEAWHFDIETLLGRSCLLSISHKKSKDGQREYSLVNSASPLMKGQEKPEVVNELKIIDVNTATEEQINELYDTLREKIKSSKEWKNRMEQKEVESNTEIQYPEEEINPDDIPF